MVKFPNYCLPGEFNPADIEACEWDQIFPDEDGCRGDGICEVRHDGKRYFLCPDCEERFYGKEGG